MKRSEIKQGDVWMVNLDPTVGSEQGGVRPCLVVSADRLNEYRENVIIVPITSSIGKKYMINHYNISNEKYPEFKRHNNIVLLECVRDISIKRLERKITKINSDDMKDIMCLMLYDFKEFCVDNS